MYINDWCARIIWISSDYIVTKSFAFLGACTLSKVWRAGLYASNWLRIPWLGVESGLSCPALGLSTTASCCGSGWTSVKYISVSIRISIKCSYDMCEVWSLGLENPYFKIPRMSPVRLVPVLGKAVSLFARVYSRRVHAQMFGAHDYYAPIAIFNWLDGRWLGAWTFGADVGLICVRSDL